MLQRSPGVVTGDRKRHDFGTSQMEALQRSPGVVTGDRRPPPWRIHHRTTLQRSPGVVTGDRSASTPPSPGRAGFNAAPASSPGIVGARGPLELAADSFNA